MCPYPVYPIAPCVPIWHRSHCPCGPYPLYPITHVAHCPMGYRGNRAHGQCGNSIQGVWGTGGIGHMANGAHGQWGHRGYGQWDTGGNGYRGYGPHGQWGPWAICTQNVKKMSSCQKDVNLSKICQMSKNQTPRLWRRFTKN